MTVQRLFRLSSLLRSAVSWQLRRNVGLSAAAMTAAKNLDPVQKLFLDKIRDYNTRSKTAGGVVDAGPEYQKNMADELAKLQRLYGSGGEDLAKFPTFTFPGEPPTPLATLCHPETRPSTGSATCRLGVAILLSLLCGRETET
ncbi:ATP5J factor, partial [Amia calva]|nr:ATP5J factor [Amia calva]